MRAGVAVWVLVMVAACPKTGPALELNAPRCVVTGQPFTVEARLAPDDVVEHVRFDLGDGSTALITRHTVQSHTYRKPGRFTVHVSLALTDGRQSDATHEVDVQTGVRECGDELTPPARRFIDVDACVDRGVLGCLVDLGSLAAGEVATQELIITNPGTADTRLETMDIIADEGNAFTLVQPQRMTVRKGGMDAVRVQVSFIPQPGTYHVATLRIRSNAENLPGGQEDVRVLLTGSALDAPVPRFEVTPPRCDFGGVVIGESALCELTLRNSGTGPLHVVNAELVGAEEFRVRGTIVLPLLLGPGASSVVRVELTARAVQEYRGTITLDTTDPANTRVEVPLQGAGIEREPVAIPRVDAINGLPALPGQALRPLNDVTLTGLGSMPGRAGRSVVAWRWELVAKPDTSTVTLSSPNAAVTGFVFNSSGLERPGLDVIGDFVVKLTVTDDGGLQNSNDGRITLSTTAGQGIHVQLTWEDPLSDIDLHLMRRATADAAFGGDDCFYSNCTGSPLNWGGGDRDPSLDIDDTNGFGPENIRVSVPEMGRRYLVGVHFYARGRDERVDIPARVQVFLDGQELADMTTVLRRCNAFWSVGVVRPFTPDPWSVTDAVTIVEHASCRE